MTRLDFLLKTFATNTEQMKVTLDTQQTIVDALEYIREKKEWIGIGTDEEIIELSKDAWGRDKLYEGRASHKGFYVDFARLIETKLKEKNNG